MNISGNFSAELANAIEERTRYVSVEVVPSLLDRYRNLYENVNNLLSLLSKKRLIMPDPYRLDKKITSIIIPESDNFAESDRAKVIGLRLSDLERTLDYLCNYFTFSIQNLTLDNIKKLLALNNTFIWGSLTPNNTKPNTQGLGYIIVPLMQGPDLLTRSTVSDITGSASKLTALINEGLRDVSLLQRELYKQFIRDTVFSHHSFSVEIPIAAAQPLIPQVKKLFLSAAGKKPFYTELVCEALEEDFGDNSDARRQETIAKLKIEAKPQKKKAPTVNTKDLLMMAVRVLAGSAAHIDAISSKITENKQVLDSEYNTFFDRFKLVMRRAFKLPDKPVIFTVMLTDPITRVQTSEDIRYYEFMIDLAKRSKLYGLCAAPGMSGYQRLAAGNEEAVFDFLSRQLKECHKLMSRLEGIDAYFKNTVNLQNRPKIRGIKIELDAFKNSLMKANQYRAEYTTFIEEQKQMKKLGIIDEDTD